MKSIKWLAQYDWICLGTRRNATVFAYIIDGSQVAIKFGPLPEEDNALLLDLFFRKFGRQPLCVTLDYAIFDHGIVRTRLWIRWCAMVGDGVGQGKTLKQVVGKLSWPELQRTLLDVWMLFPCPCPPDIHRDIKQSNVLCENTSQKVKLTDFGLVQHWFCQDDALSKDCIMGTPVYMAPEQFAMKCYHAGPWTDLYSVGCMVWHLVCESLRTMASKWCVWTASTWCFAAVCTGHRYPEAFGLGPAVVAKCPEALSICGPSLVDLDR